MSRPSIRATDDGPARLSQDATIVLALAGMAMSFASSEREEAERWLRLLRMHGEVGRALQGLGVGEVPLEAASTEPALANSGRGGSEVGERVDQVCARACEFAQASGSRTVGTVHILFSVLSLLGGAFDRELYRRGGSREELLARLDADEALRATT